MTSISYPSILRGFGIAIASFACISSAFAFSSENPVYPLPGGAVIEFKDPLSGLAKKKFGEGWTSASFKTSEGHRLRLFPGEQLNAKGGTVFEDFDATRVSPTGRYAVLSVVRQGTLEGLGEVPHVEGREYCPVIETVTGCIVSMPTGDVCGGAWASRSDIWLIGTTDRSTDMTKKATENADALWSDFRRFGKRGSMREYILQNLGIYNVLACDSPSIRNRASYLAIAGQLRKESAIDDAAYIEQQFQVSKNEAKMRVNVSKAWLYDAPNLDARTKMYLVLSDVVTSRDERQGEWIEVEYQQAGGRVLRKWIRQSDLVAN